MPEVKIKQGEELNGLGTMLKEIMDTNLKDPKKYKSIEKLLQSRAKTCIWDCTREL